jgi:hypothetical protein
VVLRTDEFQFTVDGQDFPWFISERGPIITQLADNFYGIEVEIFCIGRDSKQYLPFTTAGRDGHTPVIGGVEFPWLIAHDGYTFKSGCKNIPSVTLTFFAYEVESCRYIEDVREVYDNDGNLWARPGTWAPRSRAQALRDYSSYSGTK